MMNSVLQYIKKGLDNLYYAYYVIIENLYKLSLSWEPKVSVPGTMSLLVSFPLHGLIGIIYLCWVNRDIPPTEDITLGVLMFLGLYWLTTHYYRSIETSLELRFKHDNTYRKIFFGIIAIVLSGIIIYINFIFLDIYVEIYKKTRF